MAVIEKVIVQGREPIFLPLGQACCIRGNQGLVHTGISRVFVEETIERKSGCLDFFRRIGESRIEMAVKSSLFTSGNLPDTEPTDHMVDAESIEIAAHMTQAALPPGIVVLFHGFPVVGGETPVLPFCRKEIGRRSCGRIEVEQFRMEEGVGAVAAYPDGQVSLE